MTNKELYEKYTAETDLKQRGEYMAEMVKRAKDKVEELCKGRSLSEFFESQIWTCEYNSENDIFFLVGGDLGIEDIDGMRICINKKLLLDGIILRTTAKDGHNGLLENMNEMNLKKVNTILEKITKTNTFSLSMVELKALTAIPSLLTETERVALVNGKCKNTVSGNSDKTEQTDRERPANTDSMVGGDSRRNRANDSRGDNNEGCATEEYLRRPTGADTNWSDSEVE